MPSKPLPAPPSPAGSIEPANATPRNEDTVDELARVTDTTVRKVRAYQDRGLRNVCADTALCSSAHVIFKSALLRLTGATSMRRSPNVAATCFQQRPTRHKHGISRASADHAGHKRRTRQSTAMENAACPVTLISRYTSPPLC
jgi:hypothetical protein